MNHVIGRHALAAVAFVSALALAAPARATITSISSDWCRTCLPGSSPRIVEGKTMSVLVKGRFVDLATRVEISGSGVRPSLGQRVGGTDSSISITFSVDPTAPLGERTVKLRYAVETNGPDTFTIIVVRGGHIDRIERLATATERVAATDVPVNQLVTLVFTGTHLGNAMLAPNGAVQSARTLPGCGETSCQIQMQFTRTGPITLNLVDATVGLQPGGALFTFFYGGLSQVTVVGTSTVTSPTIIPKIPVSSTATPSTFVDVAPGASMLNLFRRIGGPTTISGQSFVQVADHWCAESGLSLPAAGRTANTLATIRDPVWGIANVGTAGVTAAFDSRLSANGTPVQTQTTPGGTLNPGATSTVTFHRSRSSVRLFRFGAPNPTGCFANPTGGEFFEDPPFRVDVDVNGSTGETAVNHANNSRTY